MICAASTLISFTSRISFPETNTFWNENRKALNSVFSIYVSSYYKADENKKFHSCFSTIISEKGYLWWSFNLLFHSRQEYQ